MTDAELQAIEARLDAFPCTFAALTDDEEDLVDCLVQDLADTLTEAKRLQAIVSSVRRCYACHAEIIHSRAVAHDEEDREWEAAD